MIIEGIATNLQDVIDLNTFGANRIELCSEIEKDGLTPNLKLVKEAVSLTEIPINVMVRPHDRSFVYSKIELRDMAEQINEISNYGADGIVLGALTKNQNIDVQAMDYLTSVSDNMHITFHKAFDQVANPIMALDILLQYPHIKVILTSGGKGSVLDNFLNLKKLIKKTKNKSIEIMPGGGIDTTNILEVSRKIRSKSIHCGRGIRHENSFKNGISKQKMVLMKNNILRCCEDFSI